MARRRHYRRRTKGAAHEIDVTTFLNLMVVLVPFLLITAVFSRLTIVELDLPGAEGGPSTGEESLRLEVIVREDGIEVTDGKAILATLPNQEDEFDLDTLSSYMIELKQQYPEHDDVTVLMEAQIPYDYLIRVMDIVRSAEVPVDNGTGAETEYRIVELFSQISVGDAP